jgi:hypothetical protein
MRSKLMLHKEKILKINNLEYLTKFNLIVELYFDSVYKTKVIEQMLSNHLDFFKILFCGKIKIFYVFTQPNLYFYRSANFLFYSMPGLGSVQHTPPPTNL